MEAHTDLPEGSRDTALASFVLLLSFLDRPVDPDQLRHTLGKGSAPLELDDLVRLAKKLDVRPRNGTSRPGQGRDAPAGAGGALTAGYE